MSQATTPNDSTDSELTVNADLSKFHENILIILAREGMLYGRRIQEELESARDTEENHGRLYPNLDDLNDMGLITKKQLDGRTNGYALTKAGRREVERLQQWVNSA